MRDKTMMGDSAQNAEQQNAVLCAHVPDLRGRGDTMMRDKTMMGDRATKRSALCARPRSEGEWGHNDEGQNDKTQSECIRKDKNIHNEVLPHVSDPRIMAKHINTH